MVDGAVPLHRGQDAQRDADQQRQDERQRRQFQRRGGVVGDVLQHGAAGRDGGAEVAVREAAEEHEVPLPQRQVEAVLVAEPGDEGRVGRGLVAKLRQHRVARQGVGDQEDDQGGQQRHAHHGQQA